MNKIELKPEINGKLLVYNKIILHLNILGYTTNLGILYVLLCTTITDYIFYFLKNNFQDSFKIYMIYFIFILVAITIVNIPLYIYKKYFLQTNFKLNKKSLLKWLLKQAGYFFTTIGAFALFLFLFNFFLYHKNNNWWIYISAITTISYFLYISFTPLVINLFYYRKNNITNIKLKQRLKTLQKKFKLTNSKKFKFKLNSPSILFYIKGLWITKHIYFTDAILKKLTLAEFEIAMVRQIYYLKSKFDILLFTLKASQIYLSFYLGNKLYLKLAIYKNRYITFHTENLLILFLLILAAFIIIQPFINRVNCLITKRIDYLTIIKLQNRQSFISLILKTAESNLELLDKNLFLKLITGKTYSLKKRLIFIRDLELKNSE